MAKVDKDKVIPNDKKSIKAGGIEPLGPYKDSWIFRQVKAILEQYGHQLSSALEDLPEEVLDKILYGTNENLKVERTAGVHDYSINFEGVVNFIERQAADKSSRTIHRWANSFMNKVDCPTCNGTRLKKEALYFKMGDKNIHEVVTMDIEPMLEWLKNLEQQLDDKQQIIAREPLKEIISRTGFLVDVGLDYLTLERSAKSLSGGEAQRIRLATQIGSELTGVLYILDEPSIGLHQRDNHRLIDSLKKLRDSGNSVIVVEHDKDIMIEADHLIDIGPGAGIKGGHIVAEGNWRSFNGNRQPLPTSPVKKRSLYLTQEVKEMARHSH